MKWPVDHLDHTGLLHIELQTEVEDDLGERLAEYAIRLWRRDHLPVRSVIMLLRKTTRAPTSPFVIFWDQQESLCYTFEIIRLWEIPYEQALSAGAYAFWPLASLMAGTSVETTVSVAERLSNAPIPRQERSDLIGLAAGLAGLALPRDAVVAALRRNPVIDELLRESGDIELYREEAMREGKEAGLREGKEKGLTEGRAAGRAEGQIAGARRIAIITLEADLREAINQAGEEKVEEIAAHSATETLAQLRAPLGLG